MSAEATKLGVSGFELVEELGRGATTAVYRALHRGREYAIKVKELTGPDDPARLAFRREAAILAAIAHPCLAKVYEVGDDGRVAYLVMELIRGRTVSEVLREGGPLSEEAALDLATDVGSALDAAHHVGLVHRDVAPRNLVLREDGRVVLIDFGLATPTGTRQPDDSVIGTVLYSAPEQTGMVRRPVDRRSDLYSLGAVLFECLTGRPPFHSGDVAEVVRLHAVSPAPDVRDHRPEISIQLSRILSRLLCKDPDDRYQDASSLLCDIDALRRGTLLPESPLGQAISKGATDATAPLVGRENEQALLDAMLFELTDSRSGSVVLVESDPGGGKTKLASELARSARANGITVLESHIGPDHPGPIGPLADAVGRHLKDLEIRDPEELERLRTLMHLGEESTTESLSGLSQDLDRYLRTPEAKSAGSEGGWHEFAVIEAAHVIMSLVSSTTSGALLILDNAQLADDATHRVLGYLAPELERLGLLVVLTSRNDPSSQAALSRLRDELGDSLQRRIELPPLSDDEIRSLLQRQLGGGSLDEGLAGEIIVRANGNPASAVEYLRSALDAGILRPNWGTFSVDSEALANLDLPSDLLALCLRRLETLRPSTRWLLTEAAVIGASFHADLLATVTSWPLSDVHVALGEAAGARVVEVLGAERYGFLHEGVRETLLSTLDLAAGKRSHEMLARALEDSGDLRPELVYDIARHFALGEVEADPARAFRANYRAARLALAAQADEDAVAFFEAAESIGIEFHLPVGGAVHAGYGTALVRRGDVEGAFARYRTALELESDPLEIARIKEAIARLFYSQGDGGHCLENARAGLRAIGKPLPARTLTLFATTLVPFVVGLFVLCTRIGFAKAPADKREQLRLQCHLLELAGLAANMEHRWGVEIALMLRSMLPANRLGRCREYVTAYASIGYLLAQARLNTGARFVVRRVRKVAETDGDPGTRAHARLLEAMCSDYEGDPVQSERLISETLRQDARWLSPIETSLGLLHLCLGLALRGRLFEEVSWLDESVWHGKTSHGETPRRSFDFLRISLAGYLEQPSIGLERIRRVTAGLTSETVSKSSTASYNLALAGFHFGLGELGQPFDDAIKAVQSARFRPFSWPYVLASFWPVQAFGRIAQLLQASSEERPARLKDARRAVRDIRVAARTPLLSAYARAARAGLAIACGRYKRALRHSQKGQRLLLGQDAPGVEVALAMCRSRALAGVGYEQEAERMAVTARRLAEDLGLTAFIDWIEPRPPAGAEESTAHSRHLQSRRSLPAEPERSRRATSSIGSGLGTVAGPVRGPTRAARQLEALLQVGAAAARVLDPEELIRLALDETVRILNAERALLFLTNENSGMVRPHIGRDAAGNDILELTGYSSTVVDRVTTTREPMVLTGTEQGAALGSDSAVVHGLRSILVAPLVMENRLLGIIYLDSRLAKGIFTHDDVEILTAITSHVAFALETARIAEMELSVESERRQREVAELLRDSMRALGQNLDPRGVLRTTLTTVIGALHADAGAVLLADSERLEVVAVEGPGLVMPPEGYDLQRSDQPEIAEALRSRMPISVGSVMSDRNSPLVGLLGRARSFVAAPLVVREQAIGAVVVVSVRPGAFGETPTKIVAALASQGVVAYENAQLFSRVQMLAQIDELSGVSNRRHFFELAESAFTSAQQARSPLVAMMLDIDHFKEVNDRYGHASGDDVIRAVAQRIDGAIGSGDLVGRYGGEEFSLVVRGTLDSAAALAEQLRRVISESPVATPSGPIVVTASVGVADMRSDDMTLGRLLQRTDAALYTAKRAGRDRVAVAP